MKKNQTKAEILAELETAQKRIAELESMRGNENDDRFASIFRASPSQMALTDSTNGKYVEVNEAFLQTLGFSRDEIIGKTATELGLFVDPAQRAELLQRMSAQGYLRDEYVQVRAKSGAMHHGIFSAEYISSQGHRLLLTVMNDVTEKIEAENRWRFALEGAGDGVWDWNAKTNTVLFSRQWKAMLGYDEHEIGDSLDEWSSRVHPDDLAATMEQVNAHLQGQTPVYVSEHRVRCKNGSYKWILDRGKVIERDNDNKPLRVIGTHKDITERKEVEAQREAALEKLRISEERYRSLIENMNEAVMEVDEQGNYCYLSPNYANLIEGPAESDLGKSSIERVHPEDLPILGEARQAMQNDTLPAAIYRVKTDTGHWRWVETSGRVYTMPDGSRRAIGVTRDVTRRKLAEDKLRESEQRFSRIFHSNPAVQLIVVAESGIILDANESFCLQTGFAHTELIGRPASELGFWQNSEQEQEIVQSLQAGQPVSDIEIDFRNKSGASHTMLASFEPITINGVPCILSSAVNITERKQAERALAKSENQYHSLIDALDVSLCRWHPDTTLTFANAKYKTIFGVQGDATGQKWVNFLPEDSRASTLAFYEELSASPKPVTYEHPVTVEGGIVRHYQWIDSPILDEQGRVIEFQSVGVDVTERKQAEEALAVSEAQLKDLLNATPDAMVIINPEGKIIMMNAQTENLFGYSTGEMVGRTVEKLMPEESRGKHEENRARFMEQPGSVTAGVERTIHALRKNGERFPAEISLSHHKTARGEDVVLCAVRDVTKQKRYEELIAVQRDLARLTSAHLPQEEAWKACLEAAIRVSGLDCGGIYLFEERAHRFELVSHLFLSAEFVSAVAQFAEETPSAKMILSMSANYFTETDLLVQAYHAKEGIRSVASIPVQHNGRVIGCLNIASRAHESIPAHAREALEAVALEIGNVLAHLKVEADLDASQKQLSQALVAARMGTWRYDIASGRTSWSPEAASIFGIQQEENDISSVLKRIHPEDRSLAIAALQESLDSKRLLNNEYRMFDDDGNIHWITNYGHIESDKDGNPTAIVALIQDVTERKSMNEKLRQSDERYQQFIALAFEAISRTEFDEPIDTSLPVEEQIDLIYQNAYMAECNQAMAKMYGTTVDAFLGVRLIDSHGGKDNPINRAAFKKFIEAGYQSVDDETVEVSADGREIWFRSNTIGVVENGKLVRLWGTAIEVTERKKAETSLRESEERFRSFIEQSTDGFYLTDEEGRMIEWNRALEKISGINREQALDMPIWEIQQSLSTPEQKTFGNQLKDVLQGILQSGQSSFFGRPNDAEVISQDGVRKVIQQTSFPIYTGRGFRLGAIVRDITESKRIARELEAETIRRRILFDESPDGILIIDPKTAGFSEFNATAHTQLGYTREEFAQLHIYDVEVKESAEETQAHIREVVKNGKGDFETLQRTKDGEIRNVHVTAQVVEIVGEAVYYCTWRDITERKRAEAARRESDDRYHLLFETMAQGVVFQDADGSIIQANPAAETILGLTIDQMQGRNSIDPEWHSIREDGSVFPGEEHPAMAALRSGEKVRNVIMGVFNPAQRSYRWININAVPRFVNGGERPYQVYATFEDITERKQAEAKLRESEQKYRDLFNGMNDTIWVIDPDMNILDVNNAASAALGYTREELLAMKVPQVDASLSAAQIGEKIKSTSSNNDQVFETKHLTKDGRALPVEVSSSLVSYQGRPAIMGIARDITERKAAEEKLLLAERRYRALIENAPDGVVLIDINGRFKYASPSVERIFGYTKDDLPYCDSTAMTHPEDLPFVLPELAKLIEQPGCTPTVQYRFKHKDGEWRWIESTFSNLLATPNVEAIIINFRDIHERKLAEEELKKSQALLKEAQRIGRIGHMEWNGKDSSLICSDEIYNILDLPPGTVITQSVIAGMMRPSEVERVRNLDLLTVQKQGNMDYEYCILRKDGSERWVHQIGNVTYDENGLPIRMMLIVQDVTERRQAENTLSESRLRLEMGLKGANAAMWDWNVKTGETVFNDRWAEIIGYTLKELEPINIHTWAGLCHPEDLKNSNAALAAHFARETDYYEVEARMKHKDGSWVWVLDHGKVMEWDAEGKPVRMFGTHLDITERKRSEQTTQAILRLSELSNETHDLDSLMRSTLDEAEVLTDSQIGFFHFVDENQNSISLQAWSTNTIETLCGAEGKGQHYPVEQAGVWADAIRDGKPYIYNDYKSLPHRRGLPAGHASVSRLAILPIKRNNLVAAALGVGNKPRDYNENDVAMLMRLAEAVFDIIMRNRAETALRQNEERLRTVADFTYEMEFWLDENQNLLYMSPSCQRITGYSREAFLHQPSLLKSIIHPADHPLFELHQKEEFSQPESCSFDFRIITAEGKTRWINHTCQTVRSAAGLSRGRRVSHRDITERREADQRLREQVEDMALVNALNEAANRGESLEKITEILSHETRRIFQCQDAAVYLLSPDGQYLILQHTTLPGALKNGIEKIIGRPIPKVQIPITPDSYFSEVISSGKGRVTSDSEVLQKWIREFADTPFLPDVVRPAVKALIPKIFKFIEVRSVITIPLNSADGTLGAIDISSANPLSEHVLERLQNVRASLTEIIKRKQVEQELTASEEKYRGLMESLNNAISAVDVNGQFSYMNDMAAEKLGGTPQELIGKKMQELFPPEIASIQMAAIRNVMNTDQEAVFEAQSAGADGLRWYRFALQPLHDENGNVSQVLINATDIHDLKTAQQDLIDLNRTLEERVKQRTAEVQDLYNNAPVGYHSIDGERRFISVNQTEANMLGYTRAELIGQSASMIFTPESEEIIAKNFARLASGSEVVDMELYAVRKDGSTFPVMINAAAVMDESGRFVSSRSTLTDITKRKQAEDELKRNVNFTSALLNAIPTPVFYKDVEGRYQGCNHAFTEIMGKTSDEIRGKTVQELWPTENAAIYHNMDLELLQYKTRQVYEGPFNDKNNRSLSAIFVKDIYYDEFGDVAGMVGAFIDITVRKQAEETMRLANVELERSLRLKDEFLASMSHELRTPLNAILGISESLLEQVAGRLNEKQLKYVNTVYESGQHLLELINDILDLAKINAGKIEMDMNKINVRQMIEGTMRMVRELAQKKEQEVSLSIDPQVTLIWADERRLKQMLVNLLGNAVKFTPVAGHIGLEIEGDRKNNILKFTVWDTGIGITREAMNLLFQPFVQLDSSLARSAQGTGLGLVLVSQMARLHGGSVSVESEPGKGSRFTISLPWVAGTHTGKLNPGTVAEVDAAPALPMPDAPTILVVEDTESVGMLIADYLTYHGYNVINVRDGFLALKQCVEARPDLILMDVMMPEMDGLETTARIRGELGQKDVPIIALTALALPGDRERCLSTGMNDYLSKPVKNHELLQLIEKYLGKK